MKNMFRIIGIGTVLAVSACGGGGSGSAVPVGSSPSPQSPQPPPPRPTESIALPGGIWHGTVQYGWVENSEAAVALVAEDGRFRMVVLDSNVNFSGNFAISKTPFQGGGQFYVGETNPSSWQSYNHAIYFWGDIVERQSLSAIWNSAWETWGKLEFVYAMNLYERPSSLGDLAGSWTGSDENGDAWLDVSIGGDGNFTGVDAWGCTSTGQFVVIDDRYNLYDVLNVTSDCDLDEDDYSGFAYLFDDGGGSNAGLFVSVDNGLEARRLSIQRN